MPRLLFAGAFTGLLGASIAACPAAPAVVAATTVVVRIAEDVCQEEEKQPDNPLWVALVCTVVDAFAAEQCEAGACQQPQKAHLIVERAAWEAVKREGRRAK